MPNTAALPKELIAGTQQQRAFALARRAEVIDLKARTVSLAFSTEFVGGRTFGREWLDHSPQSVRLDRLRAGGSLLVEHDPRDVVGVVESVSIDADRVGRAVVRFGRGVRASEVFDDIVDGIRRQVSVRYVVHAAETSEQPDADGINTYRITDWEPLEISIVSIAFDIGAGVGRSAAAPNDDTAAPGRSAITENKETEAMPQNQNDNAGAPAQGEPPAGGVRSGAPATPAANAGSADPRSSSSGGGADAERQRSADIIAIGESMAKFGADRLVGDAIRSGASVEQFRAKVMEHVSTAPMPTAAIGMAPAELKRYSLVRAINAAANPRDAAAQRAASFELECSAAAADHSKKTPQGLLVPYDVLQRDLTVGTPTAGGNLVATDLRASSFIELLRNALLLPGMGATMLSGLIGDIAIPKQSGAATAYWLAESGAPTESQQAIGQVAMSPKTCGAFTDISRKLLRQSSIDVENMVQNDLARVIGLAIQAVAILGGGSDEPTGILSTAGIGDVIGGTDGAAPDWADIVALETAVAIANADVGTLAYLTNAKVRGKLKTTEKFSAGTGSPVWGDSGTPLNGYRAGVTNAVPSNLTKGTATGIASAILFGNFADLVIGMWGGLDLVVDPYTHSTSGTVRVVALQDVDIAIRNAESFAAMKDALTA